MTVVTASKAAGVATAAAPAVAALTTLSTNEAVMLIALPLLATWIGLAGLAIQEGQPCRRILRDVIARLMLGMVAAFVALAGIEWLGLRGVYAALFTLGVGMGILTIARGLQSATLTLKWLDPLLAAIGLQRK